MQNTKKPTIIGIAGETSSGKTTIANRLYDEAIKTGTVALIKIDDYYHNKDKVQRTETGKANYDHPDSYDTDYLIKQLNELKNGNAIDKPLYDFVVQARKTETEHIEPAQIIIVEGILTFAIPRLRKLFDIKIFVDTPDDIRFIRRLKRDIQDRGRSLESVVNQYLESVRPMHIAFVEPSKRFADIIIPEGGHNDVAFDILLSKLKQLQ